MKKVVFGILMLYGSSTAYAANVHGEHVAPVSAQDQSKTTQRADTGPDNKASVSKTLAVSGCWIRSLPKPIPSAGYFVIKNTGSGDAKLTSLAIPAFGQVSLHQTTNEDGQSKMSMAHEISIPAGGELKFKPASYHAMLEKPTQALAVGAHVQAEFTFESGEKAITTCEVKPANTVPE
ncbi:copper transporter [Pollutimonas nitritireducens]|uniref:Copper transporter n=1 Tax=Pollutimonas nitritireducens TaxID=2045209 RepID=A0A2N4UCM9_9BURK|nr:copper chaperone PCu(A)C [Pollutimonas nitritireducens]PLC52779.1 copper transporter [Pollutimonas nitritireducens]